MSLLKKIAHELCSIEPKCENCPGCEAKAKTILVAAAKLSEEEAHELANELGLNDEPEAVTEKPAVDDGVSLTA